MMIRDANKEQTVGVQGGEIRINTQHRFSFLSLHFFLSNNPSASLLQLTHHLS